MLQPRHMTTNELIQEGLAVGDSNPLAFHLALLAEDFNYFRDKCFELEETLTECQGEVEDLRSERNRAAAALSELQAALVELRTLLAAYESAGK